MRTISLPSEPTEACQCYSIVLSSQSYADSPADALGMFFAQMSTGNVSVEIHSSDAEESWDLDELADQNAEDQIDLALDLITRHAHILSNHQKLELIARLNAVLGVTPKAAA